MGTIAGNNTYGLILSSAQSSGPSGDIIYFVGTRADIDLAFAIKVTDLPSGGGFGVQLGKYKKVFTLNELYVFGQSTLSTNRTTEFNNIQLQLHKWSDAGDTYIYLWVYDFVTSDYVALNYNGTTMDDYAKVYIEGAKASIDGGLYKFSSITFRRVA